jgi:hypothetical protein
MIPAPTAEQQQKMHALEAAIASLSKRIEAREKRWRWSDGSLARLAAGGNAPGGALDEINVWNTALSDKEIGGLFESRALPYAAGLPPGQRTTIELGWLRLASLRAHDARFAKDLADLEKAQSELLALRRDAPTVMVMQEMAGAA